MPDDKTAIYNQFAIGQSQYIYFLLAAAAAGIALAVQATENAPLTFSQLPLAGAVLAWALSFFAGCKNRQATLSAQYANYGFLTVKSGQEPILDEVGLHPEFIAAAAQRIAMSLESLGERAGTWAKVQFKSLTAGAALYVAWHVVEMAIRTKG